MFDAFGLLDAFDGREKAIIVWALALIALLLLSAEVRASLVRIMGTLASPKLLLPFAAAAFCTALAVGAAHWLGLLHTTSLKETVYWFFGVAVILIGRAGLAASGFKYTRDVLRRALSLTILVEFIVNLYVFAFAFELLLVPFVALLVCLSVAAGRDSKLEPARKAFDRALVTIGLLLLAFATVSAISDIDGLLNAENAEDLLVAPALTLALLPFLWVVAVMSAYEQLFLRINFFIGKDRPLARLTKRAIWRACRLRLRRLDDFSAHFTRDLSKIQSEADVTEMIDRFTAMRARAGTARSSAPQSRERSSSRRAA